MEEKVRQLLEKHKKDKDLTNERDYIKPGWDWSEADLAGWNLKGLTLSNFRKRANFKRVNFKKANLESAKLIGANMEDTDLEDAISAGVELVGANLQNANFERANLKHANLLVANLQGANLWEVELQGSDLREANLHGADLLGSFLQGVKLIGADLQGAKLKSADLGNANLEQADLRDSEFDEGTDLRNANLFQCRFDNSTLRNAVNQLDKIVIQEKDKNYSEAKDVYLILKNYFRQERMYDLSGEYYYREKLMETKCFRKDKEWLKLIGNHILHKITGFGERPQWVLLWWAFVIFLWGFFYWIFNGIMVDSNICYNPTPLEALYFSGVTFTTLGFGDIAPKPGIFQLFALLEALLGAIFMAMFIFVFARKMIR